MHMWYNQWLLQYMNKQQCYGLFCYLWKYVHSRRETKFIKASFSSLLKEGLRKGDSSRLFAEIYWRRRKSWKKRWKWKASNPKLSFQNVQNVQHPNPSWGNYTWWNQKIGLQTTLTFYGLIMGYGKTYLKADTEQYVRRVTIVEVVGAAIGG